jgi:hypothetical protein
VVIWCNTWTICKNTAFENLVKERNSAYKLMGPLFFHVWLMIYFQAIYYSHCDISLVVSNWQFCDLAYVFVLLTVSFITNFAGT